LTTCPKCGTENQEGSKYCSKCGASIYRERYRRRRDDECFGPEEEQCFGLRHGGTIAGIIVGLFIVMVGLAFFFGENLTSFVVPFILVVIGVLVIAAAASALSRRRVY
jgi:uncharacterized membrane protein YvbJ